MADEHNYKVVLLDKELEDLNLQGFSNGVREKNEQEHLHTYIVLLNSTKAKIDPKDSLYAHEVIRNVVNKDLLRLVIEKFM